jgi:hypothetical protein
MKGTIIGFAPKGEDCDQRAARHLFTGMVCKCGKVKITSRKVGPGATVEAVPHDS